MTFIIVSFSFHLIYVRKMQMSLSNCRQLEREEKLGIQGMPLLGSSHLQSFKNDLRVSDSFSLPCNLHTKQWPLKGSSKALNKVVLAFQVRLVNMFLAAAVT